jgi:hypothetical protein
MTPFLQNSFELQVTVSDLFFSLSTLQTKIRVNAPKSSNLSKRKGRLRNNVITKKIYVGT